MQSPNKSCKHDIRPREVYRPPLDTPRTARMAVTKTLRVMAKQMMEISTHKSVSNRLGDYNSRTYQGKAWTKAEYEFENNRGELGRQYGVRDWSRASLNFEIVRKNGKPVVQPIDHSKPSLQERWQQRIDEGYKATVTTKDGKVHKKPIKKSEVKTVMFDFGGDRDRMHAIAFDRPVHLGKNGRGLNGDVQRKADIEEWALDCYKWAAKKYGAENIIDFVVHLDETNPHIHCIVVPLTRDGKLSYTELFGGSREQAAEEARKTGRKPNFQKGMSEAMKQLHSDFASEVGAKWGLDRGDDIKITGATHKSTAESLREKNRLEEEIAEKNSSVLSLSNRQTTLQSKVDDLEDANRRADESLTLKNKALSAIGIKPVRPTLAIEDENERLKRQKEEALKIAQEEKKKAAEATKRANSTYSKGVEDGKQLGEQEARQKVASEIRKLANFKPVDGDSPELIAQRWRKNYDGRLEAEKEVQNLKGNVGLLEKAIQDILTGLMGFPIIRLAVNALRYIFANPQLTSARNTILDSSQVEKVNNALCLVDNDGDRKLLGKAIVELAAADFNPTDYVRGKVDSEVQKVADGTHTNLSREEAQHIKIGR